mmetsp:Transcript_12732/g.18717  ORF Transcript_12732/g.18717 Transcript_12732/m.18717 type:complete len:409 (+) Transcript_12732:122-1348(+)
MKGIRNRGLHPPKKTLLPWLIYLLSWCFIPFFIVTTEAFLVKHLHKSYRSKMNSLSSLYSIDKKPPIYITIGPQCSGKTTFLSQLQERITNDSTQKILDVAIDDEPHVYTRVDARYFIELERYNDRFLNRCIHSKSIASRIAEQEELRAILQRIAGRLSRNAFESIITRIYRNHSLDALSRQNRNLNVTEDTIREDYHTQVGQTAIEVVEEFVGQRIPDQIDLFCVETLFRPNPRTNRTAVQTAQNKLHHMAKTSSAAMSWGNTNTRPREYKTALSAAASSGRQVYFIVYGSASRVSNGVFLPALEFSELYRRNINRLLRTGRFVPAKAIWDASQRIDGFVETVLRDLDKHDEARRQDDGGDNVVPIHSKFEFDKVLTRMANFELRENRTVRYMPPEESQLQRKRGRS